MRMLTLSHTHHSTKIHGYLFRRVASSSRQALSISLFLASLFQLTSQWHKLYKVVLIGRLLYRGQDTKKLEGGPGSLTLFYFENIVLQYWTWTPRFLRQRGLGTRLLLSLIHKHDIVQSVACMCFQLKVNRLEEGYTEYSLVNCKVAALNFSIILMQYSILCMHIYREPHIITYTQCILS